MKKIAVFASGEGTNFQALADASASGLLGGKIIFLIASSEKAGVLKRAASCGIEAMVLKPTDFKNPKDYDQKLVDECKKRSIDLICLAGFMIQVGPKMLKAFPWKILNIHPSLLPAFGGKGVYGIRVHENVLEAGVRISGCTVHLIDEEYDRGKIILQEAVPVLDSDDAQSLAGRVLDAEHRLYPKAVRLFCEGKIEQEKTGAQMKSSKDLSPKKRALISVSDKRGVVAFAKGLVNLGFEIVSSSGTAEVLKNNSIPVITVEEVTGFPEIFSGRVKTLHPLIFGGILMRRKNQEDMADAQRRSITPIDLVCVNLYPFSETAQKAASAFDPEVIDQIDIGGVALIRAAAKNFDCVSVVVSSKDYPDILKELEMGEGKLSLSRRKALSQQAFEYTASYDAAISEAFQIEKEDFPQVVSLRLSKIQGLRYGENPHQKAALYLRLGDEPSFEQLSGKELSYNNLLDAYAAWDCVSDFDGPACAIFKHATPSGVAAQKTLIESFDLAWEADPLSAFGSIVAFNQIVGVEIAEKLANRFVEVIEAVDFDSGALTLLMKKANLRILRRKLKRDLRVQWRSLGAEILAGDPDAAILGKDWKVVSKRKPNPQEDKALRFAWVVSKHVKSNAIALTGPGFTVGLGAGQMSRVDSVHLAGVKYKMWLKNHAEPSPLVLASDAFFPFADGIEAAATLGISAIIQPGGSVRDLEVIAASDQKDIAMILTGIRHFRH